MGWTANLYLAQQVEDERKSKQSAKRAAQLKTAQHCLDMEMEEEDIRDVLGCLGLDKNESGQQFFRGHVIDPRGCDSSA